jgi:hypothetical protein
MHDRRIIGIILLFSTLLASCTGQTARGRRPEEASMAYKETLSLSRATAMGTAQIYIALPKSGFDEVWFYFHGAGAIDASGIRLPESFIQNGRTVLPAIVAVTFGPRWFLVDSTEKRAYSSSRIFWEEILPLVQREAGTAARHVGIGYSMGGFNLLSLFADRPSFWSSLVFVNPALAELSPVSDQAAVDGYVARTKAYTPRQRLMSILGARLDNNIRVILDAWGEVTQSSEDWVRISPLSRIASMPGISSLDQPILITCGLSDEYGFLEGSRKLAFALGEDKRLRTYYYKGSHSDIPTTEVAAFLAN